MIRTITGLILFGLFLSAATTFAADDLEQQEFFESKIRPVLVAKCYECHSGSAKEPKGGLLLDTREGIRRGGDSGHGVVPGQIDESLILAAIRHESFEMPPEEKLPDEVIADFEKWVRLGAHDPRDGKSAMIRREIDIDRAREFWSFQPIADPIPPRVSDREWLRSEIDAFVLARLEAGGVRPVRDAGSDALARRIYFDLVGLPPSPLQLDEFAAAMRDNPDVAIESLVDSLLGSRHFGERWGRHWLDVVRYAESTGMERNSTFTRAWKYRDYVIAALNDDMPFDQFVREQIAGDLLPYDSLDQRDRQLIATGMLALGPKSLNETKKEKFKMDVVDDQIDVVSRAFLGLTASCARCHDHKFDPIPQSEYYSLAGIFTSTETLYGTARTNGNRNPGRLLAITGKEIKPAAVNGGNNGAKEEQKYRGQLKNFRRRLANYQKQLAKAKNAAARKSIQKRIDQANDDIRRANARLKRATQPAPQSPEDAMLVMAVTEAANVSDTKLRLRGVPEDHGRDIPRGFLSIASLEENPPLSDKQSGRAELAHWVTRKSNPMTARVAVNRVWQHLFGRGIVTSVNNFGANGDRPTHPLLLDHLAMTFIDDGWSVKRLIRRIMTSRVYRLSCDDDPTSLAADPGNQWLWRMNQRRLEAEAIRDAMLLSSGQLDLSAQVGSSVEKLGEGIVGRNINVSGLGDAHVARSVYLPIVRGAVPEMLRLFDFPEPSIISGARDVTTVPTQALYMMNSPQVIDSAKALARRLVAGNDDDHQRVHHAYRLTLSRQPDSEEVDRALQFIADFEQVLIESGQSESGESGTLAWAGFCQSLLASTEFRYIN